MLEYVRPHQNIRQPGGDCQPLRCDTYLYQYYRRRDRPPALKTAYQVAVGIIIILLVALLFGE